MLEGARNAELIEGEAGVLEGLRELLTGPRGQFSTRDVFVVPGQGFCGRGEDWLGKAVAFLQADREPVTSDRPGALVVFPARS